MYSKREDNFYDVIVIGSGLSGLATAALLTMINKKKVLVLERHYEIGGLTHEFKRGPYSWDIGLHYVGNIEKRVFDFLGKIFFDYITDGKLKWNKMPEVFDKIIFPDFKIEIKESVKGYRDALLKEFPGEKKVINRYIRDVHKVRNWYLFYFFTRFFKFPLKQIFSLFSLLNKKKALMTTREYLDRYVKNDKLKAALVARWGNYGIAPNESSFAIHSLVEHHYYTGGVFPDGGAEKIASLIENSIELHGGRILVSREVVEIIIKNKKAIGVKVKNLNTPDRSITEYYSDCIISAAGADTTFLSLVPENLNLKIQEKLKDYKQGYSGIDVYLGLKESPERLGIKGENYWIFDTTDINFFSNQHFDKDALTPGFCFLSFPSLKSGKKASHTADIVTILPRNIFEHWSGEKWKEKESSYYSMKDKVGDYLINLVNKYLPGFKDLVVYKEVATPLTFEHFTNRKGGFFYGIPSYPDRFKIKELQVKTEIKNLYLTGVDILCNGVFPSLFSAIGTVSYLNGSSGILKVIIKAIIDKFLIKKYRYEKGLDFETEDKAIAVLVEKKVKNNYLVELIFQFSRELNFMPGQHVKLLVGRDDWRAYSVARISENRITLIIDTRPDGIGANFVKKINVGEKALFRMPITDMVYQKSDRDLFFIATGTGLVPFLHILDELRKSSIRKKVTVLFGCMNESDDIAEQYLGEYMEYFDIKLYVCVENAISKKYYKGRVTDLLNDLDINFNKFDFYICGHPHMTDAVLKQIRSKGADRIFY